MPAGWADLAGDCAPEDASVWQELPYLYRDADLDGVTVWRAGLVCSGASLSPGYANAFAGVD